MDKENVSNVDSQLNSEFKTFGIEERGCYYESGRAIVYLNNHETLDDVLATITHEVLHYCFRKLDLDEDQEERLIFCVQWADQSL